MTITKKYILEGLCCTNCASAIEREVGKMNGVESASVEYGTKSITVIFDADENEIFKAVSDIAVEIDEDIIVKAS